MMPNESDATGYSVLDGVYSSRNKYCQNSSTKKDDAHQYTTETSL